MVCVLAKPKSSSRGSEGSLASAWLVRMCIRRARSRISSENQHNVDWPTGLVGSDMGVKAIITPNSNLSKKIFRCLHVTW